MTNVKYQIKKGSSESIVLFDSRQEALGKLMTQAIRDGDPTQWLGIRELSVGEWEKVDASVQLELEGFHIGDIVEHTFHTEKSVGKVEGMNEYNLLVAVFGKPGRLYWSPEQCRVLVPANRNEDGNNDN